VKISAREVFMKVVSFYLTATFICIFNEKPDFVGSMDADSIRSLARRLRVLEFPVRFATSDEDLASNKAKDKSGTVWKKGNLLYISPEWRERAKFVLLDFLFQFYSANYSKKVGALPIDDFCPPSVKKASQLYLDSEDVFAQIFEEVYLEVEELKKDDFVIEPKYDYKLKKEVNRRQYTNRTYLGDIWYSIEGHDIYRDKAKGEGKVRFLRSYNRKSFVKWIGKRVEIIKDKDTGKDYILGFKRLRDEYGYNEPIDEGDTNTTGEVDSVGSSSS
jgi:hypothetical protein